MHDEVVAARAVAIAAHASIGQSRKYTNEPYWVHPRAVATTVERVGAPPSVIAAAWLHDVLEDTPITEAALRAALADAIVDLVVEVTDVSRAADGNRQTRKARDRDHLGRASSWGKTIKLADLLDNTTTIVAHDPNFAKVYMREKSELLPLLRGGDPDLWQRAHDALTAYERGLLDAHLGSRP